MTLKAFQFPKHSNSAAPFQEICNMQAATWNMRYFSLVSIYTHLFNHKKHQTWDLWEVIHQECELHLSDWLPECLFRWHHPVLRQKLNKVKLAERPCICFSEPSASPSLVMGASLKWMCFHQCLCLSAQRLCVRYWCWWIVKKFDSFPKDTAGWQHNTFHNYLIKSTVGGIHFEI